MLEALAIDMYSLPRLYEYIYHQSEERLCQAQRRGAGGGGGGGEINLSRGYPPAFDQASLTIHRYQINTPGWREAL